MEFNVRIDDVTWAKIRSGDAFKKDDHAGALATIIATSFVATGKTRSTTDLMIVTGKIRVTVIDPAAPAP